MAFSYEDQRKLTKKWKQENKELNRLMSYRSTAKLFARKHASCIEEMEYLVELYKKENPNYKKDLKRRKDI